MLIVDAQIHLWQNDKAPPHHRQAPYSIGDAVRDMDAAGVDRAVNCPAIWDPGANDYAVEAARLHPDRFATLGWFPLDHDADASLVDRWLEKPGMLGLRFVLATKELCGGLASGQFDWLWQAADRRGIAVGLMAPPVLFGELGKIADRHPHMRLLIDHLGVSPFVKLPEAMAHFDALLELARHPNIAIKATGVPSMASDPYPFASTHSYLRRAFEAFGSSRMFWGTDITRMRCSWRECVTMFTEELTFLSGEDLERVMGRAICDWIGWRRDA